MQPTRPASMAEEAGARPGVEQRKAERAACEGRAEVSVSFGGFLFRGEIENLSQTGCFVSTRARLRFKPDAEVEVRFTVGSGRFTLTARTASVRNGIGAGFEFLFVDEKNQARLTGLMEELKAQEMLSNRRQGNAAPAAE